MLLFWAPNVVPSNLLYQVYRRPSRTFAHVSPHSSETRAPVSAAVRKRVRHGSFVAAIVWAISRSFQFQKFLF